MGFFTQRCPNCGRSISKAATHCSGCGCPSASAWARCHSCGVSVGAESKFCWKCGSEQKADQRERFFGDRWRRSPGDFAARVELKVPGQVLHAGLLIDEGTLALVFQNGKLQGQLGPGHHAVDGFFKRMLGMDKNAPAHAVLLDTESAEVDFMLEDLRMGGLVPVDLRLRLLFKVTDPETFVPAVVGARDTFDVADLAAAFSAEVKSAVEQALQATALDQVVFSVSEKELLEAGLQDKLAPALATRGLALDGVRLAQFGGPAYDELRTKFADLERLSREAEANRRLRDAMRSEKVAAYRDEEEAKAAFDQVTHDLGLQAVEREQQREQFVAAAEHTTRLEGLRLDYEARRSEILNRLDEQTLRHKSELTEARHELEVGRLRFEEDMHQQRERFRAGQDQQVEQAKTDLSVAEQGIAALKAVRGAKLEIKAQEEALATKLEAERLELRGQASMQGLLATLSGEQADRLLKLAELEMRKGFSPEQALARAAESAPAPAESEKSAAKE